MDYMDDEQLKMLKHLFSQCKNDNERRATLFTVTEMKCDFCGYYNFNPDKNGAYRGEGWCNKFNIHKDPEDICNDFVCSLTDEGRKLREVNLVKSLPIKEEIKRKEVM